MGPVPEGLSAFVRARLDDEDRDADLFHEPSCRIAVAAGGTRPSGPLVPAGCDCPVPERMHDEVGLKRLTVRDLEGRIERAPDTAPSLDAVIALMALKALALEYASHPRWREEWRP
ncbi:DUF6221 family protein [Streptomyces sp. NPDC006510]|uniref:DUF6221 family protein n=1 Tax=Streptomyces sp. NPDC006510 TaxID=3155600 RepID=UPI0033B775CF